MSEAISRASYNGWVRGSSVWAYVTPTANGGWHATLTGDSIPEGFEFDINGEDVRLLGVNAEQFSRIAYLVWKDDQS